MRDGAGRGGGPLVLVVLGLGLGALGVAACYDFDEAFRQYCEQSPSCAAAADTEGGDGGIEGPADIGAEGDAGPPSGPDGGAGEPDGGALPPPRPCDGDDDCLESEICHPLGRVCVLTCSSGRDCPVAHERCEAPPHADANLEGVKICKCSAVSCLSLDVAAACNKVDNLCEAICTTNEDCQGFVPARYCEVETGFCLPAPVCRSDADCTNPLRPRCDLVSNECTWCQTSQDCAARTDGRHECDETGACVEFRSCDPSNEAPGRSGGPDTCAYGEYCAGGYCAPVANGDCPAVKYLPWVMRDRGPVIVSAAYAPQKSEAACSNNGLGATQQMIRAQIQFYAPHGLTYSEEVPLHTRVIFYRLPSNASSATEAQLHHATIVHDAPASGAEYGTFTAVLCGYSNGSEWSVRLADAEGRTGNAMCLKEW